MTRSVVVGLGRSGLGAARLLRFRGSEVIVLERSDSEEYRRKSAELQTQGIDVRLGQALEIASFEPWLWKRFCAEIGLPDHGDADLLDAATSERVKADVAAVLATRTADYWEETLGPKSVCVTAVQSLAAMLGSDHAGARGMVAETRHDVYGTECHLANPIALSLTPAAVRRAAPVPGEDDHTPSQALREDTAT